LEIDLFNCSKNKNSQLLGIAEQNFELLFGKITNPVLADSPDVKQRQELFTGL
jgi:hypothetical protein